MGGTRKSAAIVLLLFFASLLAACSSDSTDQPKTTVTLTETQAFQIALVMKTLTNPFFVEMEKGAREAEAEFNIELLVRTAAQETSIEQQIEIVNDLIRDQVDAIVIAPGDSFELIPVLKQALDAGIVVVNIDNRLDQSFSQQMGLSGVPFISVDNEQAAYLSTDYISDQIEKPTDAVIIEGIRSAQNAEDRKNGAIRAFEENEQITIVAIETANWKIDEAYAVAQTLFETYPEIGAVFCANDMMALGVIQYLADSNREGVLVAAYDALAEARQAVRDSTLQVTIDQQAAIQGYHGVEYAIKMLQGETPPSETIIDVKVVTAENVDD